MLRNRKTKKHIDEHYSYLYGCDRHYASASLKALIITYSLLSDSDLLGVSSLDWEMMRDVIPRSVRTHIGWRSNICFKKEGCKRKE